MAAERSIPWLERRGQAVANALTLFRVLAIPFAVGLLASGDGAAAAALMALMFLSDALDGRAARRAGQTASYGARLDVLADRAVEWSFWLYFGWSGALPFWFAGAVMFRTLATGFLRRWTLLRWRRALCEPVWSKGGYGFLKMAAFVLLALGLISAGRAAAWLALGMCLLRATPVFMGAMRHWIASKTGANRHSASQCAVDKASRSSDE